MEKKEYPELKLVEILKQITQCTETSGCYGIYSDNPILIYPVVRLRKSSRPMDRIYAVLQIFGLGLGLTALKNLDITIEDLEDHFGQAILLKSPILAQMSVHTEPAEAGRYWRISGFAQMPGRAHLTGSDEAAFGVKSCAFKDRLP